MWSSDISPKSIGDVDAKKNFPQGVARNSDRFQNRLLYSLFPGQDTIALRTKIVARKNVHQL
jgi:hypothetical protein